MNADLKRLGACGAFLNLAATFLCSVGLIFSPLWEIGRVADSSASSAGSASATVLSSTKPSYKRLAHCFLSSCKSSWTYCSRRVRYDANVPTDRHSVFKKWMEMSSTYHRLRYLSSSYYDKGSWSICSGWRVIKRGRILSMMQNPLLYWKKSTAFQTFARTTAVNTLLIQQQLRVYSRERELSYVSPASCPTLTRRNCVPKTS